MSTDVASALATLQLDPDNTQALKALAAVHPGNGSGVDREALSQALSDARRFHRERSDFELCVQLIDLELAWTSDRTRRAGLLHEKGRILSDELLRDQDGQACVRAALDADPQHGPSRESQAQMALVQSNWKPIAARYLQQAEEAADAALASSLYGSVAEFHLKYGGSAKENSEGEAFLRKSLERDPHNRRSSLHLERLLRDAGRWDELLPVFVKRAEVATARDDRALAWVGAAELSARIGRKDDSLAQYRKALEANPIENRALRPVSAALTAAGNWAELIKVLENAARTKRGEQDVALLVQLGTLLWKQLAQIAPAESYFRRVRKIDPGNREMVEFYRAYYTERNELPQLLSVLAQAQKTEPDLDRRVAMGIEMARAADQRPQNAEKTIELWKGLLRLKPHLPEAVQALRRLYARTEKWNALLELLKEDLESVPATDVDERVKRYLEIVAIYRDHLNLDVMVVNTYLNVLALKPDHPAALAALAVRYEAQGRWTDLIQILTRQADAISDPAEKVALHRRVATLWAEKLGKHHNAVASLEKILEATPTDTETRTRLKELYTRSRSWRQLVEVHRNELPTISPVERKQRLGEMARIAADRLNDVREAINLWNQVLAIDTHDGDALAGLAALYERERRWPALIEILERQSHNAVNDPATELPILERRGMLLYEKLGAGQAAIDVFRRIQTMQPGNARATRALREIYAQLGDLASLEALYVEQGAYGELCDQLTALADRTPDLPARTRLLERVALLATEKLRQPERALKAYERILATDPHNRKAAQALVPLYRAAQKWPRLLSTYEALLGAPGAASDMSVGDRLELLTDARQICEQRLGSKSLAFQWCARAFEVAPRDAGVIADLDRLAAESDEWAGLATLFARRLESATDQEERLWLLRRSLRIATSRLYKPQEARRFAEELLALGGGVDQEADSALEQIFTQSKAWPDLAKLLQGRAARLTDTAEKTRLLLKIAQLEEEKVADLQAAARTLEAIVSVEPSNERALRALVRVLEARQDWAGLVQALRRELALRTAPGQGPAQSQAVDREELLLRIGQLQEARLGDLPAAFATYREILQTNATNPAAVAGLERLGAAPGMDVVDIARLSVPLYQRTDNITKLAAALETLAGADTGPDGLKNLHRLRALYSGSLKDPAAAYRTGLRIFTLDPADQANREQLVAVAAETQAVGDLVERMRAVANATKDGKLRRDLLVEIAELHEQRLGRAAEAEHVYSEILQVEPEHAGAFRALSRLHRDAERWPDLRALLESRQALLSDPRERIELLAQIAEIDESVLDDGDHAVASYEMMLQLDPTDLRAHRALDRHYAARERWHDLEELLGKRIALASPAEVPELEFRRAEIRVTKFDDIEGALIRLESIVERAPSHEGARRLLERLLALPAYRQRASKILEPLYEASGAWARLVTVLEMQREALQGRAAAALLARIADLQENKLQARTAALATWRQVLAADPQHADALTEIERLATALERFSELVDVYQELAFNRDTGDLTGRADLLSRAARLYAGRLNNRRAAIDVWKLVLNLDPNNVDTAQPAAAALEGLYAETGDIVSLVRILHQQVRWTESVPDRKAILFRIAGLEEKSLVDIDAAVGTLRAVLEIDPENREAIDTLERIFETGAQHRQRVEILRKRIDLAHDPAARQELWRRVASLLERDVGDVEEAIAACVSILDENPEDANALETLARLYEQQGRHRDRLEILERRLALTNRDGAQNVVARVAILRQIAGLLEGPLGDPADALERWREILPLAPADPEALAALERFLAPGVDTGLRLAAAQAVEAIYERAGNWPALAAVIQVYIESQDDPRLRVEQLARLAALQETKLRDPEGAFRSYGLAIREAISEPELPAFLDAYERLAGEARGAEVAALYREITPDVFDEGIKLRLDRFVAEASRRGGDLEQAAEFYRRVLDRVPDDDASLAALEQIYRDEGDIALLYEVLTRRSELAKDPAVERGLRLQLGALGEKQLGRLEDAIASYERVLELAPREREASDALDRLYTQTERWGDLARFLNQMLERGLPERDAVAIRFRLANIEAERQHDKERALEHLRVVLAGDPDHPGAIAMLEGMLDDLAVQGAAAELLEPVYAGRADWPSLIKIGEIRLLQVEEPSERLAWTKRIARLYEEQLEDYESALRWYGRVFQEAPAERLSAEQLLRLADKLDRWQDVASLFATYLEGELSETPAVLEVVRRAAEIFDLRLGNREEARKYYRRLFDARPDDGETAELIEGVFERWESWLELRELIDERAARAAEPAAKKALLRRSARLDEERLDDRGRAVGTLREVLEIDPTDQESAQELERLLREDGQWHDLAELLTFSLDRAATSADRDAVAYRLANLLETRLDDVPGAIDRYAEIVERTPTHREAVTALERLVRQADYRYRVATILEPIYRKAGDFRRLVVALDAQLDSVEDRDAKVKILGEMADIYQRLARLDLAFDCRSRAWLVDVASQPALAAMQTLASSARLHGPLAETLEKGALSAIDPELQGQLWSLAARVIEEHLGDPPRAIEAWRHALAARPDDQATYVALERLLTAAGRMPELVDVLEKHLELATSTHHSDRKFIAKRIAVLYEEALRQPDNAVRAWQNVLEIDEGDQEALEALSSLFHNSSSWHELAEIYERKISLTPAVAERRVLRLQAAQIYDDKLGAPDEAVGQLRSVLDETEGDAEALERLDKLLSREGRHSDLLEVLDLRRAAAVTPAARDELGFRAAKLVESELGDTEAAIGRYQQMLSDSPNHQPAREALWAIARGADHRLAAIAALEPILRQGRDWNGVVELLELRLGVEDDVTGRLRVLAEIARIEEQERKDPKGAFDAWARALTEEATADEPRQALERLSASRGDYAGLAQVYEERMDATFDASLQRTLALRLADLYENRLGDLDRAADFLRKALSLPGEEAEVLAGLDRVLRRTGAHHDLAEVLAREAELSADPTAQADFLASLGEVRLRAMDDAEGALSAFRDALERNPGHRGARDALAELLSRADTREGALEILEPMAEARGDYEELVALYDYRLSLHDDRTERAHWLRRIAEVYDTQLGSPDRAIQALGRALMEEPFPGAALEDIERIATAGKIPSDAAELIEAVLPGAEPEAARELALRAARLYELVPADRGSAERLYARVLESDPENVDALTALERFHRASGDSVRLARVLERRAGIELDPGVRRRMLVEAARLHEKVGATPAAVAAWQALRAAEEGDAEALGELARLYERAQDLPALCDVLAERARFSEDPAERAKLYARIGEIKLGPLNDLDGAAEAYREAMEGAPEDAEVLAALELLETRREDWSALQEVLQRRLGASRGAEHTAVLQKLARNAEEKLSDTEQAVGYLHQILADDPGHTLAYRELERILRAGERWYDLVDVLGKHADAEAATGNGAAALELRVAIADVWEQKLDSPESAAEALEKVLEVAPNNVAALLSLARLHEAAERWDEAGQALERAAAAATSGRDAAEIHYRNAQILRARQAPASEIEALLVRALDNDQTHRPTLQALEAMAREANEPDRLVQILQLQLDISEDDAERRKLLAEIAALYKKQLGHPAQAVTYLELLAQLAPEEIGTREELAEALMASGRADEAAALMRTLIDQLTKARRGKDVARYHQRLGAIAEGKGDAAAAADSYGAAYKLDPSQPATLVALGRLALSRNDLENARKFYRALLLQNFDEASSGVSKAEVYLVLGRLHVAAKEIPKARNMFERGLEIDPRNAELKKALAALPGA